MTDTKLIDLKNPAHNPALKALAKYAAQKQDEDMLNYLTNSGPPKPASRGE